MLTDRNDEHRDHHGDDDDDGDVGDGTGVLQIWARLYVEGLR